MADTMRQKILAALKARGATITIAGGFNTNAGLTVRHGWRRPAKGDVMPRIALVSDELPEPDELSQDEVIVRRRWPVHVIGLDQVAADDENALDTAETLLADLKRAFFDDEDRTLAGLLSENRQTGNIEIGGEGVVDREDGGVYVGAFVTILITFIEGYGAPEIG